MSRYTFDFHNFKAVPGTTHKVDIEEDTITAIRTIATGQMPQTIDEPAIPVLIGHVVFTVGTNWRDIYSRAKQQGDAENFVLLELARMNAILPEPEVHTS